jgi:hypothetical protein
MTPTCSNCRYVPVAAQHSFGNIEPGIELEVTGYVLSNNPDYGSEANVIGVLARNPFTQQNPFPKSISSSWRKIRHRQREAAAATPAQPWGCAPATRHGRLSPLSGEGSALPQLLDRGRADRRTSCRRASNDSAPQSATSRTLPHTPISSTLDNPFPDRTTSAPDRAGNNGESEGEPPSPTTSRSERLPRSTPNLAPYARSFPS